MSEPRDRQPRTLRVALILFVIYVLFYTAFVALSAFSPATMKIDIGGVNLAIVYGFGLIILAFVLALIYMFVTARQSSPQARDDSSGGRA
jgi:uncharacterized membrane protein (DUF485 family)